MGWFDDQIKERKRLDDEVLSESFAKMAGAVLGSHVYSQIDTGENATNSIEEILKFYGVRPREVPENIKDISDRLEYLMRPSGIMRRTVELEKGWYKDAVGAMLAIRKSDGSVVAMIPKLTSGYSYFDYETGKRITVNRGNESEFDTQAIAFYKPFPMHKLKLADLVQYMISMLSVSDMVFYALSMLVVTLVGVLLPKVNHFLYSEVIEIGDSELLFIAAGFLVCVTVSRLLFSGIKALMQARVNTKLNISVESATMMRVLSLPPRFFRQYSSGNLAARVSNVSTLCDMIVSSILSTGLSSLFSLVYFTQIFRYAATLVVPSLIIVVASTAFSLISTLARMGISRKKMDIDAKESGMSYALISGVQKIKLSGAEKRAFARWGNLYSKGAKLAYNPPLFLKVSGAISTAITLVGTMVLYTSAVADGITVADYGAFMTSFAMISAAFSELTSVATSIAQIKPIAEMTAPILETVPEVSEGKSVIGKVSGGIELNNVSFRYTDSTPNIIDDLSLKVKPGEYLAIVGKTGCGKSTLVRLLLGFEKPQSGAIYYDGKDIESIDLKSLRRKIGVVMQEGRLFQGDIFSNIVISAPELGLDAAWAAAEMAGIADDIRNMPMGMYTLISEGAGGISGGQRQRLMIARAVAPKPKILIFDEATSALDNITQKKVSESLDSLKCTRIVIAHRLSTIKNCDRIICLDKGTIIEDGTYDELIAKGGFFAELVSRQRVDA